MLHNIGLLGPLLIAVVTLVLPEWGKISNLRGKVGKGIAALMRGLDDSQKVLGDRFADARNLTTDA
jgi:sec-independent protein translocase protein TatA